MKEDLIKIIEHYGVNNQLRQFNEECFELIEAIFQYESQKEACENIGCSRLHIDKCKEHIAEEIADVLNMVEQFMFYYEIDFNKVIEIKHQKVHRQLDRIEKEAVNYLLEKESDK